MEATMDYTPQIISYGLVFACIAILGFAMMYSYLS
jgi:hypothetical protein